MLKRVFASILAMFMVLTLCTPTGSALTVKANDVETFGVITEPVTFTKTQSESFSKSYNNESATLYAKVKLTYTKQIIDGTTNYSNVSAKLINSSDGHFYTRPKGSLTITKYFSSGKVYVSGEVYIYYNNGASYQNVNIGTYAFNLTFTV